jgi:hypothetical protein
MAIATWNFLETMLAWQDDNPNLLKNILWMSAEQHEERLLNRSNKFEIFFF